MKFFIDTADLDEIRDLAATGLIDGATTNPSLVAKAGRKFEDIIAEICEILPGPVSAEVTATDTETMVSEGRKLAKIAANVTIKVPLTPEGLKACKMLSGEGTKVNVTLCFSAGQAILAAKSGATFVSPFIGRLDDIGLRGMDLIDDICTIFRAQAAFKTEVLVASIRSVGHVIEAAKLGAHVVTIPPSVLRALYHHPLTDKGLAAFLADWETTGQSILDDKDSASSAAAE
ncbi:MAG: fructose-6-phosphate aldolase [Alphaproteobacteria bacterium]|nr:fructose-6-phosphate aldolase [Pseudomonadota bacterium]TDI63497.1 MAG: fructose-6-phosphate aldolase [Alphaproteobacteria bacterium]